jgi:hypothetical protein
MSSRSPAGHRGCDCVAATTASFYRPLTSSELQALSASGQAGFLVERVIDRGDLERAAAKLPN